MMDPEDIERKLINIRVALEKLQREKKNFLAIYPEWAKSRNESIKNLNSIAEQLNYHKKNVNIASIVGSSVGISGGVAGIVGAVLLPFPGLNIASPFLLIGGGITSILGGTTSAGSNIVGAHLCKQKLKEAKDCLEKDSQMFTRLERWFESTKSFRNAVSVLMDIDDFKDVIESFNQFCMEYEKDINDLRNMFTRKKDVTAKMSSSFQGKSLPQVFQVIMKSHSLLRLLFEIVMKCNEDQQSPFSNRKSLSYSFGQIKCLIKITHMIPSLRSDINRSSNSNTPSSSLLAEAAVLGTLNIVTVAFNIIDLVGAVKELTEDSSSEYAVKVLTVAEQMSLQLADIKEIHEMLQDHAEGD